MWPQIVSSMFAGAMLALAAMELNSPGVLLALAVIGMLAWESHRSGTTVAARVSLIGILSGACLWLYLLFLIINR